MFPVIRRGDYVKNNAKIRLKLGMTALRIENVQEPGVLEQHDANALRGRCLTQNPPIRHGSSAVRNADVPARNQGRS